jgi:flagellin
MAFRINTNVASLNAQQLGSANNRNISNSLEKLSSGLRINKAADDASGLQIADSLRSQANTLKQSISNANDAIKIIQIADNAIDEQSKIADLVKQKTIQAAQAGQNEESRKAIQRDIDKLMESMDNIANTTQYNGQSLLSGQYTGKKFQIGEFSSTNATLNIGSTDTSKVGHTSFYKSDTSDILSGFGTVDMKFLNVDGLHDVDIESVVISTSAGTGIGALAEAINKNSDKTGIRASYEVVHKFSNKEEPVYESTTSDKFKINGVTIGKMDVKANDSDGTLVNTINNFTDKTGVIAYTTNEGYLRLRSEDGRGIDVEDMWEVDTSGLIGKDGDPRVNVSWTGDADLDIVVVDPNGEAIGYHANTLGTIGLGPTGNNKTTSTFGEWDVDDTGGTGLNQENFFWKKDKEKPEGKYSVQVKGFGGPTYPMDFTATIITNGRQREVTGTINSSGDTIDFDFEFYNQRYKTAGELTLTKTDTASQIEISGTNLHLVGMDANDNDVNKYVSTFDSIRVISSDASRGDAIAIADSTIASLDKIRSNLGSTQNQLISSINSISVAYVNVKSSESQIRDVDFADESANFQKSNILAQAGSYAMSQANLQAQSVQKFLQ